MPLHTVLEQLCSRGPLHGNPWHFFARNWSQPRSNIQLSIGSCWLAVLAFAISGPQATYLALGKVADGWQAMQCRQLSYVAEFTTDISPMCLLWTIWWPDRIAASLHSAWVRVTTSLHSTRDWIAASLHSTRDLIAASLHSTRDQIAASLHSMQDRIVASLHSTRDRIAASLHSTRDRIAASLHSVRVAASLHTLHAGLDSCQPALHAGQASCQPALHAGPDSCQPAHHVAVVSPSLVLLDNVSIAKNQLTCPSTVKAQTSLWLMHVEIRKHCYAKQPLQNPLFCSNSI
jgi:hypothetical protein